MKIGHKSKTTHGRADAYKWLFPLLGAVLGTLSSVVLLLIAALVIKNISPSDGVLSIISTCIKIAGSFVCVNFALKRSNIHPLILGLYTSFVYMLMSCALFILLSKSSFDLRMMMVDLFMSAISGVLFSIILGKKSLFVRNK